MTEEFDRLESRMRTILIENQMLSRQLSAVLEFGLEPGSRSQKYIARIRERHASPHDPSPDSRGNNLTESAPPATPRAITNA